MIEGFNRRFYEFHDTELSSIVRHGFHALAIDEHRESYEAAIWDPKFKPNQTIEQVWFCGAHSNVGGGYANHDLADIALAWMAEKAGEAKLGIDKRKLPKVTEDNAKGQLVDSYGQFLKGAYAKVRERAMRKMGHTRHGQESVHATVRTRYQSMADYRPKNPIGETIGGVPDPRFGRLRNL